MISFPIIFRLAWVLVVVIAVGISAQAGGDDWIPVSPSELALKASVVEPNADAEAIFWDIRIDDGGENDLVLSHYVRIKIFTERGREQQSKIEIPFISGIRIKDVGARTIKPDGSITELPKTDIVEKTVVSVKGFKLRTKSFAFPAIQRGAIIEYRWREVISKASASNLRLWFQREIPIQSVTYRIKPLKQPFDVHEFNMPRLVFKKEKNGFYSTTVRNMTAFEKEPFMPPDGNVRSWALVKYDNLASSLVSYHFLARFVYLGFQLYAGVNDEIKRKSAEITAGAATSEEKLERIYTFCRAYIRNTNTEDSGFGEEETGKLREHQTAADILKRGFGSSSEVDLLFAALTNAAGFRARVALLPDRSKWLFNRRVFVPGVLHRSGIAVWVDTQWKFFAPGDQYTTPGMLRWQQEGVDALIVDESTIWVVTPMSQPEKSIEKRSANLCLDEHGTLEGDVSVEFTGHLAVERKVMNEGDSPAEREETLKQSVTNRLSTAELTNIVIENATDPKKPFIYRYHVRVPRYAERTGKRLFLKPGFFHKDLEPLFTASARRYPVYFQFPWSEEDKITITLPEGFVLESADRPVPIDAGSVCRYEVNMGLMKGDQRQLIYNRSFRFGGNAAILFPPEQYEQIKRLFDEITRADNHVITLKEKTTSN